MRGGSGGSGIGGCRSVWWSRIPADRDCTVRRAAGCPCAVLLAAVSVAHKVVPSASGCGDVPAHTGKCGILLPAPASET